MLITITGPSGSGKGFIKEKITQKIPINKELTWLTTRPIRNGGDGNNRINVSNDKFQEMTKKNQLVLMQELYGNLYGLKKSELFVDDTEILFTELHIDNFLRAVDLGLNLFSIALIPTNLSVLESRLVKRETEDPNQIKVRIAAAKEEVEKIEANRALFSIVINFSGDFEKASIAELTQRLDLAIKGGCQKWT